ncbi:MAG: Sec-independent protein translocase subunit TatA/TatB [Vulcanimicrobiaceae bacterium]
MPALARVRKEHLPKIRHTMFSAPDIIVVGVLALLLFGPERLPGLMRGAGRVMREVRNTSQSFVSEMERAADYNEPVASASVESKPTPITPPSEPLP